MIRERFQGVLRHFTSIALISGFVFDYFTLWRIDLFWEDLIFIVYLSICAVCIVFLTVYEGGMVTGKWADRGYAVSAFMLQFLLGGLFGRFFIFYSRSGSVASSWPFLLFLALLFAGNELLKKKYLIFSYRMTVFSIALFSFAIFYVPILMKEISEQAFLLSGGLTLILMGGLIFGLSYLVPKKIHESRVALYGGIGAVYVLINVLYFTNILPPLPLSLEDGGVFHNVSRAGSVYTATQEHQPWYVWFERYPEIHLTSGERVYVFSAVFAPTDINTNILHEWQRYDEAKEAWITVSTISFSIVGGRDGGYRSYSFKEHTSPGLWRVNIRNQHGQLIGRIKFTIVPTQLQVPLETKNL